MRPTVWRPGPGRPVLGDREVHVWRFSLDQSADTRSRLAGALDGVEQERASKFATEELRQRYVVGRGVLRHLLSLYLDTDAARIQFRYGEHGKPFLTGSEASGGLQFNLSHSHHLALLAVTAGGQIGVDLERVRQGAKSEEIADRFFSRSESARLHELPAKERTDYFFTLWTCKEAFVKAHGGGVTFGLDRFDVELEPGGDVALIAGNRAGEVLEGWYVHRLEPQEDFAGALAIADRACRISTWDWSGEEKVSPLLQ